MPLSAGALACIQDDGCFTLVCGDSSLCLCLTKCQQVSYSKIWQEELRSVTRTFYSLHTVKLTFIYRSVSSSVTCLSLCLCSQHLHTLLSVLCLPKQIWRTSCGSKQVGVIAEPVEFWRAFFVDFKDCFVSLALTL